MCKAICARSTPKNPAHKHLLVLAPGINFIDSSGAELLAQEVRRRKAMGGALYFTVCRRRQSRPWSARATCRKSGPRTCSASART
jgi:anti-anti-sigma regulatory factor